MLIASAALVGACAVLASKLRLETDLAALLPSSDPSVVTMHRVQERLGSMSSFQIAIESPDKAANLALADRVVRALAHEPELVERAAFHIHEEQAFFERTWWLYVELKELQLIRERLEHEVRWRKNPLLVDIDDDGESLEAIEARLRHRSAALERYPDGYFMSHDGRLVVIMLWLPGSIFGSHAGEVVLERVRAVVTGLSPDPTIRISYVGQVPDAVGERRSLQSDLIVASVICFALVGVVVLLYFGRPLTLFLVAVPATCGVTVALALASCLFGHLNASTAFLVPIIVGNGINAAIIQLARYEEERRAGATNSLAVDRSVTRNA